MQFAISQFLGVQRIVHIFGAGTVNGDEVQCGKILTFQTFIQHFGGYAIRCFFFKIVARQRDPPGDEMIVSKGDELG
ncbi:hypothetical protein D3C81_1908910 [compost metagenome]